MAEATIDIALAEVDSQNFHLNEIMRLQKKTIAAKHPRHTSHIFNSIDSIWVFLSLKLT